MKVAALAVATLTVIITAACTATVIGHNHNTAPPVLRTVFPIALAPRPAAPVKEAQRQLSCIASAIWHEAGNQPVEGRIAVAEVVIARVKAGRFGKTPCAVIAAHRQFSFVRAGIIPSVPIKERAKALALAVEVASGQVSSRMRGALYFHATYVSPGWNLDRLGQIGAHVFYAEKAELEQD